MIACCRRQSSSLIPWRSLRSPPALKACSPAPVRTMQRRSPGVKASGPKMSRKSSQVAVLSAFLTSGRLNSASHRPGAGSLTRMVRKLAGGFIALPWPLARCPRRARTGASDYRPEACLPCQRPVAIAIFGRRTSMPSYPKEVSVSEVGPRDGLQIEAIKVATADKIDLVERLVASGIKKIEVSAFVHPTVVPQLADAEQVCGGLHRRPDVRYAAFVPNAKGAERAIAAGVDDLKTGIATSDTFNALNVRMTTEQ